MLAAWFFVVPEFGKERFCNVKEKYIFDVCHLLPAGNGILWANRHIIPAGAGRYCF